MTATDLARLRARALRWRILQVLDAARPGLVSERVIGLALDDADCENTTVQVRRELDYLRGAGLVDLSTVAPMWAAALTTAGVDVVEYSADAPAGVRRPRKW